LTTGTTNLHLFSEKMDTISDKTKRCLQIFRDVDCIISDIEKDYSTDEDIEDIYYDSQSYEILKSLDLNHMKKHIINCVASLIEVTKKVAEMNAYYKKEFKLKTENSDVIMTENKVFSAAVSIMSQILVGKNYAHMLEALPNMENVGWNPLAWAVSVGDKVEEDDIKCLYLADPLALDKPHLDVEYEYDKSLIGYSPAHLLCMRVNPSLSLIKFLVGHNPMAFNSSCSSEHELDVEDGGYSMYPLHLAAENSQSIELLQILLQLDQSVTKKKAASYCDHIPHTPLGFLCFNKESPTTMDMILCLIKVDSSVEVIEDAIISCLSINIEDAIISCLSIDLKLGSIQAGSVGHYKLTLIELLLKANPEAAQCRNELIMREICIHTNGDLFTSLMSLFLAINKKLLKEFDSNGDLPIHIAAKYKKSAHIDYLLKICPDLIAMTNNDDGDLPIHFAMQRQNLAVIECLLRIYPESASKMNMKGEFPLHFAAERHSLVLIDSLVKLYPEAASMSTNRGMNILHYAVARKDKEAAGIASYFYTRFPNLIHERNGPVPDGTYERCSTGYTPFLLALANSNFEVATAMCQIDEQVIRDVVLCTEPTPCTNLSNPLHIMTREFGRRNFPPEFFTFSLEKPLPFGQGGGYSPVSKGADCLRLLISLYPEAAGIDNHNGKSPYEYARHNGECPYMLRLLLRAAPTINPDEFHRLNYMERRQAMFLAFRAIVSSSEVSIWRKLKIEDENLLRYVVSFL